MSDELEVVITMEGGVIQHVDLPPGVRVRVIDVDDDVDLFFVHPPTVETS